MLAAPLVFPGVIGAYRISFLIHIQNSVHLRGNTDSTDPSHALFPTARTTLCSLLTYVLKKTLQYSPGSSNNLLRILSEACSLQKVILPMKFPHYLVMQGVI